MDIPNTSRPGKDSKYVRKDPNKSIDEIRGIIRDHDSCNPNILDSITYIN